MDDNDQVYVTIDTHPKAEYYCNINTTSTSGNSIDTPCNYEAPKEFQNKANYFEQEGTLRKIGADPVQCTFQINNTRSNSHSSQERGKLLIDRFKYELKKTRQQLLISGLAITAVFLVISLVALCLSASAASKVASSVSLNNMDLWNQLNICIQELNDASTKQQSLRDFANTFIAAHISVVEENVTTLSGLVANLQHHASTTQSEITRSVARLQSQANATEIELSSISNDLTDIQGWLSVSQTDIDSINSDINSLHSHRNVTRNLINTLSIQTTSLQKQLRSSEEDLALISNKVATLETLANRSTVDLYRSCHKNYSSCEVNMLRNNNRRLICNTPEMDANITVSCKTIIQINALVWCMCI